MSTGTSSKRSTSSPRGDRSSRGGSAPSRWTRMREFTTPVRAYGRRMYHRGLTADLWDVPIMLLATTLGLAIFGCIMVLSASSVTMISQGQSPFSQVSSQIGFLALGLVAMAVLTRIPVGWYHKKGVAYTMLGLALLLQLAVVVMGVEVNGNRNWVKLGSLQIQPSEFSKLAIVMWLAWVYNRHGDISRSIWRALFPSIFGVGALLFLIMLGGDMGTAMVYGFIFVGMMWLAGASRRAMIQIVGAFLILAALGVLTSPNRVARIFGIWGSCTNMNCDQANSGEVALATGGFLGVGLGQSRQKYNYLAEAHNDYIFAIIGEELGLLGTMAVLLLYVGLVYCAVRIMLRTTDPLVRLATGGIMIWLTSQAIINMGMVSRMLPVIGVPLPFVSYGGSSLLSSLMAAGLLLAFARQTPLRGATDPSHIENQSTREIRRANADWRRRLPLQAVVEQEDAARTVAGGHLLRESNPMTMLGSSQHMLRCWLGFDPDQRRALTRMERDREREAERAAREEDRRARQRVAREKNAREETRKPKQSASRPAASKTAAQKQARKSGTAKSEPKKPETQKQATQKSIPWASQQRQPQHRGSGALPAGLQPLHSEGLEHQPPRQRGPQSGTSRAGTRGEQTPRRPSRKGDGAAN